MRTRRSRGPKADGLGAERGGCSTVVRANVGGRSGARCEARRKRAYEPDAMRSARGQSGSRGHSGTPRWGRDPAAVADGERDVEARSGRGAREASDMGCGVRSRRPWGLGGRIGGPIVDAPGHPPVGVGCAWRPSSVLRGGSEVWSSTSLGTRRWMWDPVAETLERHAVSKRTTGRLRDHSVTSAASGSKHVSPASSASAWRRSVCGSSKRTVRGPMAELPGRSPGAG